MSPTRFSPSWIEPSRPARRRSRGGWLLVTFSPSPLSFWQEGRRRRAYLLPERRGVSLLWVL